MLLTILLSVFFLVYHGGLAAQKCDPSDCIPAPSCPAALERASEAFKNYPEKVSKLQIFFEKIRCETPNTTRTMHICCSQMSLLEPFESNHTVQDATQVNIIDHPNLSLLPDACGPVQWNRILIPIKQNYPWLALIAISKEHQRHEFECSGSLINDRYVLTSAQCVRNKNIAGVRLGEADRRLCARSIWHGANDDDCYQRKQDVEVEEVIIHKGYKGHRYEYFDANDIALIRFKPTVLRPNIVPLCLPKTSELLQKNLTNTWALVADWKLYERNSDENNYPEISSCMLQSDTILCNKDSPCEGDLGSPLMVEDSTDDNYRFIQYGVLVDTPRYCFLPRPRQYTKVTLHIKWILDNLKP